MSSLNPGGATPLNSTASDPPLIGRLSTADRWPAPVGAKPITTGHAAPGATVRPLHESAFSLKSALLTPVTAAAPTLNGEEPVLCNHSVARTSGAPTGDIGQLITWADSVRPEVSHSPIRISPNSAFAGRSGLKRNSRSKRVTVPEALVAR